MADPQWLMGALAADDAYRPGDWPDEQPPAPPDSPWARGVAVASDYAGREPPAVKASPEMGSVLGMGEAGRHLQDAARTVPGAIVRGGVEAAKFAGHLGALEDPELDLLGQQGAAEAERQIEAKLYQPQTTLGDYTNAAVRTVANPFNALGAGGMAVKQGVNLLSGLAGEYGARAYPEHPDIARGVFGFLPGVAGHALPAADAALQRASGNTVGAFGGKNIQPTRRQVGGPEIGVSDPFPGSTGLERPQGNWIVRHNTGTPELVISGEGGHGFSSSKMGVPVEEARFDIRNPVPPENPKVFDIEELQRRKAAFILAGHDRLMGGGELVGAGGRTFKKPVPLEAGSNYPMVHEDKVLLPDDPEAAVLFANAQGPATKFNRVAEEARQQGYDPYLAGVLMNKTSGDSAKQMGRTVHEALRVAPVGKDLAGKIDASIEGALGTVKGKLELPFPGIKSREFGQWLDDIGGAHRAAAIKAIDQKRFVKEGAPDVGELRIANTNPLLLNTPVGSIGRLIGAMRPEAGTLNAGLHSTYGTTFFGNRGEIGGLPGSAPFHLMAPDVHRGLLAAGPAKQFANVPAFYATLEMPKGVSRIQPVTQEVVDNYLGFIRKHPGGWATAGAVPFAGEAYRRMGGLADQSEYQQ